MQGRRNDAPTRAADLFGQLAKDLALDLTATEIQAFRAIVARRADAATRTHVPPPLFESLQRIQFPTELWAAQSAAIKGGLLDPARDSWGLAAPTGTGKSFISRLLILDTLSQFPGQKVLYIVPSRALVYGIPKLALALKPLEIEVAAVTPQLVELQREESEEIADSAVLVLTPEKADMLLRLGEQFFADLCLVIVDEAHHIESSTRGILLEMYLWRLKKVVGNRPVRFVFLSAVTPNIVEIAGWAGKNPGGVVFNQRPTRMRAGIYRVKGAGASGMGSINYTDGTSITIVKDHLEIGQRKQLVQLASELGRAGSVLVVASGKKSAKNWPRRCKSSKQTVAGTR